MPEDQTYSPQTPALKYRLGDCTPAELVDRPDLSRRDKLAVLRQWDHDAIELMVADEENMGGGNTASLSDIRDAIRSLQARQDEGEGTADSNGSTVREVMTTPVRTVHSDNRISEVARQMAADNVGLYIVLDGDAVSGVVTDRDIAVRVVGAGLNPAAHPIADVMTNRVVACHLSASLTEAADVMSREGVRRLCVVDDEGALSGLVSLSDLALGSSGSDAMIGRVLRAITRAPGSGPSTAGGVTSRHSETNQPGGLHVYHLRPKVGP
jgi:CBS domain-containing protein